LISSWQLLTARGKVVLVVYLVLGGAGSLYTSYFLFREAHHWTAWAFSILILDPIAVASVLCLIVLAWPRSALGELLAGALRRARVIAIGFIIVFGLLVLGVWGMALLEAVKARR
jgi:hypothetical protein